MNSTSEFRLLELVGKYPLTNLADLPPASKEFVFKGLEK